MESSHSPEDLFEQRKDVALIVFRSLLCEYTHTMLQTAGKIPPLTACAELSRATLSVSVAGDRTEGSLSNIEVRVIPKDKIYTGVLSR